jgi:hypothetical protein
VRGEESKEGKGKGKNKQITKQLKQTTTTKKTSGKEINRER